MADTEGPSGAPSAPDAVVSETAPSEAPTKKEKGQKEQNEQKDQDANEQPLLAVASAVHFPPQKSSGKDFYQCIGLLVVFGLLCAIGFVVIGMTVLNNKDDKGRLLTSARKGSVYHGAVNVEPKTGSPGTTTPGPASPAAGRQLAEPVADTGVADSDTESTTIETETAP